MILQKKLTFVLLVFVLFGTVVASVEAQGFNQDGFGGRESRGKSDVSRPFEKPGYGLGQAELAFVGQIISINSNNFSLASRSLGRGSATTTYTVDVSNALIIKQKATTTISSLVVGDLVIVRGTLNGTNIKAKIVRDGVGLGYPDKRIGRGLIKASSTRDWASTSHPFFNNNRLQGRPGFFGSIGNFFKNIFR